jgi:hypothetical protein
MRATRCATRGWTHLRHQQPGDYFLLNRDEHSRVVFGSASSPSLCFCRDGRTPDAVDRKSPDALKNQNHRPFRPSRPAGLGYPGCPGSVYSFSISLLRMLREIGIAWTPWTRTRRPWHRSAITYSTHVPEPGRMTAPVGVCLVGFGVLGGHESISSSTSC